MSNDMSFVEQKEIKSQGVWFFIKHPITIAMLSALIINLVGKVFGTTEISMLSFLAYPCGLLLHIIYMELSKI